MKLKEKLFKRTKIYRGRAVDFSSDEIMLPNGKRSTREYLEHPGAAAVIPFIDKTRIVLVKQYRFPVGKITYEIPAGKLSKGENPAACVRRELEEETGFYAGSIKKLISYWPTPAFSNEVLHLYEADNLRETSTRPDDDEFIEKEIVAFSTALRWIKTGKIMDSKTIITLLYKASKI